MTEPQSTDVEPANTELKAAMIASFPTLVQFFTEQLQKLSSLESEAKRAHQDSDAEDTKPTPQQDQEQEARTETPPKLKVKRVSFSTSCLIRDVDRSELQKVIPSRRSQDDLTSGVLKKPSEESKDSDFGLVVENNVDRLIQLFEQANRIEELKLSMDHFADFEPTNVVEAFVKKFALKIVFPSWNFEEFCCENLIDMIMDIATRKKHKVLRKLALLVFHVVVRNIPNKKLVYEKGAIKHLLVELGQYLHDAEMSYLIIRSLRNLAMIDENEEEIGKHDGVAIILAAMVRHRSYVPLQVQGAWALTNITCRHELNSNTVRLCNGFEILMQTFECHHDEINVKESISWCLANCVIRHKENSKFLGEMDNFVSTIVNEIDGPHDHVDYCEGLLRVLAGFSRNSSNAQKVVEAGVIEKLMNFVLGVEQQAPKIVLYVCRCLFEILWNPKYCDPFLKDMDGFQFTQDIMESFSERPEIVASACTIFFAGTNTNDKDYLQKLVDLDIVLILCGLIENNGEKLFPANASKVFLKRLVGMNNFVSFRNRYHEILAEKFLDYPLLEDAPVDILHLISTFFDADEFTG